MSTEELTVDGADVATLVARPELDIRLGPRPYLHPVRTLGGTVVTGALCSDHPWHMGVSLAMQDVNGVNFWGGRTYVRDRGYQWLDDHGRIVAAPDGTLRWQDQSGTTLITERRRVTASPTPGGWQLLFRYALSAPRDQHVVLGSPATNGRPGGAGYGGFFWRAPESAGGAVAYTDAEVGEEQVNGSRAPWVALETDAWTLVFEGLRDDDRWFVRTGDYLGVCAALAFERPLTIAAGGTLERELTVRVYDAAQAPPTPPPARSAARAT